MELDNKDIQLLEILEKNAKVPVQELSEETGIPASTVHHRIKKLESNNIIRRYTAELNPKIPAAQISETEPIAVAEPITEAEDQIPE